MGTRGILGFRYKRKDYMTYNHWDSYPSGLGNRVVEWARDHGGDWDSVKEKVERMVDVSDRQPTAEEVKKFSHLADLDVSTNDPCEWYVLLRHAQGDLDFILEAGVFENQLDFIRDSLFCEWAYIINLDNMTLEIYEGFQDKPHSKGRYSKLEPSGFSSMREGHKTYYPCALVRTLPLEDIPEDWIDGLEEN
jgi:hypothetical protein